MQKLLKLSKLLVIATAFVSCSEKDDDDTTPVGMGGKGIYFELSVDGVKVNMENIHYARTGKTVHLSAYKTSGLPNLNITLTATDEVDFRGNYTYHYDMHPGSAIAAYGIGQGNGYESHWFDCPPSGEAILVASPGAVKIENIERANGEEYIIGTFTADQYQPQGDCPYVEIKTKKLVGKFRLKKAA